MNWGPSSDQKFSDIAVKLNNSLAAVMRSVVVALLPMETIVDQSVKQSMNTSLQLSAGMAYLVSVCLPLGSHGHLARAALDPFKIMW